MRTVTIATSLTSSTCNQLINFSRLLSRLDLISVIEMRRLFVCLRCIFVGRRSREFELHLYTATLKMGRINPVNSQVMLLEVTPLEYWHF